MKLLHTMARGFTLMEMAIVLVVIGLVVGGGLTAISPIIQSSKVTETRARLDGLESALILYAIRFSCLPCPAAVAGDGTAQFTGAAAGCGTGCTSPRGVVPWQTLGLSRANGSDAFGTRISYEVTPALVVAASMQRSGSTYTPLGDVDVTTATGGAVTTEAAYVLISHGPNRHYGYTEEVGTLIPAAGGSTVEDDNDATDSTYIQDEFSMAPGATYFDDIVRWRSKPIIVQMCGDGACGNPA